MCFHHLHYNSILQSKNSIITLGVGKSYLSMSTSSNAFALECRVWVNASSASSLFSNRQIKRSTKEVIFLAYSIFLLTRHAKGLNMPPSMCNPPLPHWKFSTWIFAEIRSMYVMRHRHYKHVVSLSQPHPLITSEKQFNKNRVSWLTGSNGLLR